MDFTSGSSYLFPLCRGFNLKLSPKRRMRQIDEDSHSHRQAESDVPERSHFPKGAGDPSDELPEEVDWWAEALELRAMPMHFLLAGMDSRI